MKYLSIFGAFLAACAAPLSGQSPEILVTGGGVTLAEVFPVGPGVADIAMGPLYGVFLGPAPANVRIKDRAADRSGKGEAQVGVVLDDTLGPSRVCFVPIRLGLREQACGDIDGRSVRIRIDVGALRNAPFGLYPVFADRDTGAVLAFAAHPDNTQYLMRCAHGTDMASVFFVDESGTIRIATPDEMRQYADAYCGR
jgi:hypothetical protein